MQRYYDDNYGVGGYFAVIKSHMEYLVKREPACGYFLEPTKSILVVYGYNVLQVRNFLGDGYQICDC